MAAAPPRASPPRAASSCRRAGPTSLAYQTPHPTTLPAEGFLATNVLDRYQGRGAFAGTLADEDREGDPDRWCSLTPCGQEVWQMVWQMVWQWVWNLRLAFSAGWSDTTPLRQTEWAPPHTASMQRLAEPVLDDEPDFGPLEWARAWGGRLGADAFVLQEDGMLRCPQGVELWLSETRRENAFTQRLIDVAKFMGRRTLTVLPARCVEPVWDGLPVATAVDG